MRMKSGMTTSRKIQTNRWKLDFEVKPGMSLTKLFLKASADDDDEDDWDEDEEWDDQEEEGSEAY